MVKRPPKCRHASRWGTREFNKIISFFSPTRQVLLEPLMSSARVRAKEIVDDL